MLEAFRSKKFWPLCPCRDFKRPVRSYVISDSSGSEEQKYMLYDQDLDPLRSSIIGTMKKVGEISRANETYIFCAVRHMDLIQAAICSTLK